MANKGTKLEPNQYLERDDYLLSQDGRFKFLLQGDGNLCLYNNSGKCLWNSNTYGKAVSKAIMQQDGNFVIYGYPSALWNSGSYGKYNSYLVVQNDGNVVIYEPNTPVWATNTNAG